MTPLLAEFLVGGAFGVGFMLALSALPRLGYTVFLLGLTGLASVIALEGPDGFLAIVDRALVELTALIPAALLIGVSAGMMSAAIFNNLPNAKPEDPR